MTNPSTIACPADAWTKVLTNVTTANIATNIDTTEYYVTHRNTGDLAPTVIGNCETFSKETQVRSSVGIDVYVWAHDDVGSVDVYGGPSVVGDGAVTTVGGGGGGGDVNLIEVGGTAVAAGTAAMAAALPVTIASDDTLTTDANALLTTIDADTSTIAGDTTSLDGKQPALGTAAMAASIPTTIATDDTLTTAANALLATIDTDTGNIATSTAAVLAQLETSLADTTDVAATTHYYPDSDGFEMAGYKDMSLSGKLIDADGTLTMTVEATNDDASPDWVQVYGYDDKNSSVVNSWTVTNDTLTFANSFNEMNYKSARVKLVASGATNTVIVKMRQKAL